MAIANTNPPSSKGRFFRLLLMWAGVTWLMYAVALVSAPYVSAELVKGVLGGMFVGAFMWSNMTFGVSVVAACRDRYSYYLVPAALSLPLALLTWWHLVYWRFWR